jgi:membrane peptidoglycan carboxypeptidase
MKRNVKRVVWDTPHPSWLRVAWVEAWESRHQIRSLPRWVQALFGVALLLFTIHWETTTGVLESHLLSHWAKGMTFYIQPGPTNVVFPRGGPTDVRRGYTRIPEFTRMLESRGYRVAEQARFSPALAMAAKFGISPPYREPAEAGLAIEGADGGDLFEADHRNGFASYQDIPSVVARSLLFIENRELDNSSSRWSNPAIDWGRWTKAVLVYSARRMGLPVRVEGGSTLAVQVEKYRHSDEGRTGSPVDKLRQVLTASLRVYQEGPDTREERRHILVDYLNSVPLGATRDRGEIFGLNQGLSVWFGLDPNRVMEQIRSGRTPAIRARALKQVLGLLCAVRAPSRYLREDHEGLERRANAFAGLLAKEGVFDEEFAERIRATPLSFAEDRAAGPRTNHRIPLTSKATNRIRIDLERALAVDGLYDLNRLHLNVESTVDAGLQRDTEQLMAQFADSSYLAAHGLHGEHLLSQGDPKRVIYSVLLCERTPDRNEVRIHADNLKGPFDVNEGMKMSLGSTAKVRTLVHYLEIVERLHGEISPLHGEALREYLARARDPLTRWAAETLRDHPELPLDSLLTRATERVYSANPGEMFFTGGGLHAFVNFDDGDNHRRMTVRDAAAHSTNLVFVRLMRDLVRYHEARLPYNTKRVLSGQDSTTRRAMLTQIIDEESRTTLGRAYRDYHGLTLQESVDKLLGPYRHSRRSLAILYLAWNPNAPADSLASWLDRFAERDSLLPADRLMKMYAGTWLGLEDYAYLLGKHPLEIWTVGALARNPNLTRDQLVGESGDARRIASAWLFRTRNRHAQDLRLRTRFEQDAFERMTPSWRRLGFPFQRLVPSYATAIGSSADRPAALAELMGIIVNDGEERPTQTINRLVFAPGTPYHTALEAEAPPSQRLLSPAIARTARDVLRGVVANDGGTARRLKDVFHDADGNTVVMGGKTGTGDNRFDTFGRGGRIISSRVVSRTSAFTFYIGDRYYGVVTASVYGTRAGDYRFTSALPLRFLELLAPSIEKRWKGPPADQVVLLPHLPPNPAYAVQHVHPDVTLVASED